MTRATIAIALVLCAAWANAEDAVNPPPQPLHKVGDHWTPYDPPTEFPPDANVYIIQPGDTLWDLARKNLGNPYLWPQLWEKNTYIRDAHWIYPGDPLVVGVKAAEVAPSGEAAAPSAPAAEETPAPMDEGAAVPEGEAGQLVAVGSEDDLYCFAYLDDAGEDAALKVTSAEDIAFKAEFVEGDILFLSGGEQEGVQAGQEFFLVSPGRTVRHPSTGAVLGRVMRYIGQVRVLCTQDHSATAEIVASCDPIPVGTWLKPFEAMPIPMAVLTEPLTVCDVPNTKPKGYIVYSKDDVVTIGQDHVVMVDLGEADQVSPGTTCTVYRDNPHPGMPRIVLGEAAVLSTGDHWATAKIINSNQPLYVGDRVEVK